MPSFTYADAEGNEQTIDIPDDAKLVGGLTISGKTQERSAKDLVASATKSDGADARFQEASDLSKEAEQGRRTMELLKLNRAMTQEEFVEYAQITGIPDADIAERWGIYQDMTTDNQDDQDTAGTTGADGSKDVADGSDEEKGTMADNKEVTALKEELAGLKEQLSTHHEFLSERAEQGITSDIKNALDKHPQLGKLPEEAKSVLVNQVRMSAASLVRDTNAKYGPSIVDKAVTSVAADVGKLGVLSTGDEKAKEFQRELTDAGIGLGPSTASGVSNAYEVDKPIARVPVTDPNWKENVIARGMQDHIQDGADSE